MNRIISFLNPEKYRFGTGYQLIQSKIAIGSGSALGKGFLQGTQKKFAFLPEQHTDFIFSVLAEEFGFLGCLAVLSLYLFLVIRMFRLASQVRNRFAGLVIVGIASALFIQATINFPIIAIVLFLIIRSYNALKKGEEETPAEPPGPSEEAVLLTEIRDLLKERA